MVVDGARDRDPLLLAAGQLLGLRAHLVRQTDEVEHLRHLAADRCGRLTLDAEDIPPSFPVQQARTVLDYDFSTIGDRSYLLPLRAEVRMRSDKLLTKNDVEFRMYRKFSAEASVKFDVDTPAPLSEEQTKEQAPK